MSPTKTYTIKVEHIALEDAQPIMRAIQHEGWNASLELDDSQYWIGE